MAALDWEKDLGSMSPESSPPRTSSPESSPVGWIKDAKKKEAEFAQRNNHNSKLRSQNRSRRQYGRLRMTSTVSPTMSLSPSDRSKVTRVQLEQMYKSSVEMRQTLQELNASKDEDIEELEKQLCAARKKLKKV